jgi:hypothetical protein
MALISGFLPKNCWHTETAILDGRGLRKHFFAINALDNNIGTKHVHERERMRCGRHAIEVKGGNVLGVIQHGAELFGVAVEIGVGEFEPSEISDLGDIVASETGGHGCAS